jgi:hypothetical protein
MKTLGFFLACLLCAATSGQGTTRVKKSKLKESEVKELVQAVQDEIYDYEYEDEYFPEGGPVGEVVSGSRVRVPLYIDPVLEDREGQAIYKLMPDGEVLRRFHVHQDGMVVLDGDPELGFPATQPDRKTVYLKDSEVCRMKREWVKASFDLDLDPDAERVKEAVRRQKQRNGGFSAWEFARSKLGKKPPRD